MLLLAVTVLAAAPAAGEEKAPIGSRSPIVPGGSRVIRRARSSTRTACGSSAVGSTRFRLRRATSGTPPTARTGTALPETAAWKHSDLGMTLVFDDKMWFMGGWYNGRLPGHSASNEVWCSTDGATWEQATKNAAWSPRIAAAAVVFKGKMWLLGGTEDYYFGDDQSLKNDVWSSADGKHWTLATDHAGWSPRAYHQAAFLNGKIYVFGGGNYVPNYRAFNDVWSSG